MKGDDLIMKNVLQKENGVVQGSNECRICHDNIEWYSRVEKNFTIPDKVVKTELIVEEVLVDGEDRIAVSSITIQCPRCWAFSKYTNIKWKV